MVLEGNILPISFMAKLLCRSKSFILSKLNAALILFWRQWSLKGNCQHSLFLSCVACVGNFGELRIRVHTPHPVYGQSFVFSLFKTFYMRFTSHVIIMFLFMLFMLMDCG